MTVATTDPNAVGSWDPNEFDGDTGLEDVGAADVVLPRLQIVHDEAKFKDNLSGVLFDKLDVVILGLIKQRIMWAEDIDEGDKPQCKSPDFMFGFPNMREDIAADKRFPWDESNFSPADARPVEIAPQTDRNHPDGWSSNGLPVLNCASCKFTQWGTNPKNGKPAPPPCTEQHTYAVIYKNENEAWTPALLTFQRTGIKPSKTYLSSFAQAKQPLFTVNTTLELTLQSRGTVKYSVPVFRKGTQTDRNQWGEYATQYRAIRDFVRSAPRRQDEEGGEAAAPSSNENTAPVQQQASTTPAPTPAPAPTPSPAPSPTPPPAPPSAVEDDDDLPF